MRESRKTSALVQLRRPRPLPAFDRDLDRPASEGSHGADPALIALSTAGLEDQLVSGLTAARVVFEQVAAGPVRQASAAAPELVRTLVYEVVPRLQAELEVLVPALAESQVPSDLIAGLYSARPEAGILAEQLSQVAADVPRARESLAPYVQRTARRLADLLGGHVALELRLVCEFLEPHFEGDEADRLLLSLSAAEDRARDAMVFVAPPNYLSTEAHHLRNYIWRPHRLVRLRDIEEAWRYDPTALQP